MKVKLPVVTKNEIIDGRRVFESGEREFELDLSLGCQMRWEAKFPALAEKETFVDYSSRLQKLKSENTAVILSKIKVVYCLFDTAMSFTDFLKMFDFTNIEFTEKLLARLDEFFTLILNSATEKN